MPSQKQLKWSQLKVGLTVLAATVTLGLLIFLMSGTGGLFTSKIELKSYFDNANGLREGAPVRLAGVDIGNVTKILVVRDREQATHSRRSHHEGEHPLPLQPAQGFADPAFHRGRARRDLHRHRQLAGQGPTSSERGRASQPRGAGLWRHGARRPGNAAKHGCA